MSMVKVIAPGSYEWGESQARLVKTARAGLRGDDLRAFVKRAGHELADALQRIDLRPGDVPVHLLAVGATEFHGPNRNGDGFEDAVCRKYHPTFVKHARWYRNHCFPAGTPVVAGDRRRVAIESLAAGDVVVTRDGPRKVVRVMKEDYDGPGVSVRVSGSTQPVISTPEHPVLIIRREDLHCRRRYCCLTDGDHQRVCRQCRARRETLSPAYVPAGSVRPGDYVLVPAPACGTETVESKFAELVGWVASEGNLHGDGYSIQFTFSSANTADLETVTACLLANGVRTVSRTDRDDGLTQLSGCSKLLAERLRCYVRGIKNAKRLTAAVLEWDRESLLRMLGAYISGDGHVSRGHNGGQLRIRSSSPAMLHSLADVMHAVGVPTTANIDSAARVMMSPTNGRYYQGNPSGCVAVNAHHAPIVCRYSRKKFSRNGRQAQELRWRDCYLRRVNVVEPVSIREPVYNLEVEGVHHYLAGEFVVHNCNKNPEKSYGVIKYSYYNPSMHRIELLAALNGTKEAAARNGGLVADEELEKLAGNEDIAVSMACKVPFDICSGCNNRARNRGEYCRGVDQGGHCKMGGLHDRITLVDDGGNQLYARNTEPTFFDMSKVFRPADRIAWVTGQVKAAGDAFLSGAQLADAWQVSAPAHLSDDPRVQRWSKLAARLADVERRVEADGLGYHGLAWSPSVQPDLPWDDHGVRPAEALSALQLCRVCPPLGGYIKMAGVSDAGPVAAQARKYLPGIYGRMLNDGTIDSVDLDAFYGAPGAPPPRARSWAEKRAADYGLSAEDVRRRTVLASLRGEGVPAARRPAAVKVAGAAYEVATNYALFKLALLDRLPRDDDFPGACGTAVRQNYV